MSGNLYIRSLDLTSVSVVFHTVQCRNTVSVTLNVQGAEQIVDIQRNKKVQRKHHILPTYIPTSKVYFETI